MRTVKIQSHYGDHCWTQFTDEASGDNAVSMPYIAKFANVNDNKSTCLLCAVQALKLTANTFINIWCL